MNILNWEHHKFTTEERLIFIKNFLGKHSQVTRKWQTIMRARNSLGSKDGVPNLGSSSTQWIFNGVFGLPFVRHQTSVCSFQRTKWRSNNTLGNKKTWVTYTKPFLMTSVCTTVKQTWKLYNLLVEIIIKKCIWKIKGC